LKSLARAHLRPIKKYRVSTARLGADRDHLWLLLLLALVLFSSGLGLRDPLPAYEPRFTLVAKQMVNSGDWLFPHRGDELYPDKQPLFMWAIAAFYWLTGSLRVAFLLPSLLAGLFTTWLIYDTGARLWRRRVGLYAGLALITIFQFTLQAKSAQIDATLRLWTTLALYGLLRHLLLGPSWGWYVTAFAAMGFGIITKGVGFLPVMLFLPDGYARFRRWPRLAQLGAIGATGSQGLSPCWLRSAYGWRPCR
jgi:4-amino-4-deoxy-L-arabinose transferase-like glycosyltransferase